MVLHVGQELSVDPGGLAEAADLAPVGARDGEWAWIARYFGGVRDVRNAAYSDCRGSSEDKTVNGLIINSRCHLGGPSIHETPIARGSFVIAFFVLQASCGWKPAGDCTKHIKAEIPLGLPAEQAKTALRKCGFKIVADPVSKTLYGDKLVEGIPVSERTQVTVTLDSENKVAKVFVTTGLVGP